VQALPNRQSFLPETGQDWLQTVTTRLVPIIFFFCTYTDKDYADLFLLGVVPKGYKIRKVIEIAKGVVEKSKVQKKSSTDPLAFCLCTVVAFSQWACPAIAQDSPTLKAGISRSVGIAPIDPGLAPGNVFDQNKADALLNRHLSPNDWYKIPSWYAGYWQRDQLIRNFSRNDRTGKEDYTKLVEHWRNEGLVGTFVDKTGQYWAFDHQGFWTTHNGDTSDGHIFTFSRKVTVTTSSEINSTGEFIAFMVDKKTQVITSCMRGSTDSTFHQISDSALRETGLQRTYDWQGSPIQTVECESIATKIREFVPEWRGVAANGMALYLLWGKYLTDRGLADQIPDPPAPLRRPADFSLIPEEPNSGK
jgi:hypothetical protein